MGQKSRDDKNGLARAFQVTRSRAPAPSLPPISVGIDIGEGEARVKEVIKDFGIQYPVVRDADTSVSRTFKVIGTPTIVFLDKKGSVQYFGNELPKDYAARLNTIIGS
jgi:hypothetical protein